jgi:cell division protein FtsB
MLDERARALLDYVDAGDLIMMLKPDHPAADPTGP